MAYKSHKVPASSKLSSHTSTLTHFTTNISSNLNQTALQRKKTQQPHIVLIIDIFVIRNGLRTRDDGLGKAARPKDWRIWPSRSWDRMTTRPGRWGCHLGKSNTSQHLFWYSNHYHGNEAFPSLIRLRIHTTTQKLTMDIAPDYRQHSGSHGMRYWMTRVTAKIAIRNQGPKLLDMLQRGGIP